MSFYPLVFVPWPPALPNCDMVLPQFLSIAASGVDWLHLPGMPADKALNTAGKELLKRENTHLVTLDWDHVHPVDILERFAKVVGLHPEVKILGGLNFMRSEPHKPCAWIKKGGEYYQPHEWQPGIIEAEYIGFGCVAIHREVFEGVEFPWFVNDYGDTGKLQDVYFCNKAQAAGFKVYCDYDLTSPHIGTKLIGEKEYREYYDETQR